MRKKTIIIYLLLQFLIVGVLKASAGPPGDQVVTICQGLTKTLIGPSGASGYQWFKDGQPYSTASEIVVSAAGKYQLVVTSNQGCSSQMSSAVIIQVAQIPVASIASVQQPNCSVATGSLVIAPVDSGSYSINGGNSWQSTNTYNNLTPGNYNIMVRNAAGCTSSVLSQTITNQPLIPENPVIATARSRRWRSPRC